MITDIQFEALAALAKLHSNSVSRAAAKDVFVLGLTLEDAADKHGSRPEVVDLTVKSIHRAIRLTHTAVTGIPGEPA